MIFFILFNLISFMNEIVSVEFLVFRIFYPIRSDPKYEKFSVKIPYTQNVLLNDNLKFNLRLLTILHIKLKIVLGNFLSLPEIE